MDDIWQTYHRYNQLVRRELARPLNCTRCKQEQSLEMGRNDEPVLYCYFCSVETEPGLKMYEQIRAVVKEHFSVDKNYFKGPV